MYYIRLLEEFRDRQSDLSTTNEVFEIWKTWTVFFRDEYKYIDIKYSLDHVALIL